MISVPLLAGGGPVAGVSGARQTLFGENCAGTTAAALTRILRDGARDSRTRESMLRNGRSDQAGTRKALTLTGGEDKSGLKMFWLPAESNTGMFSGNSNWRGPVWMPVNALIVPALLNLCGFIGDDFKVQCPTGSGRYMTLFEVAQEMKSRLAGTFLRDETGWRPVYGGSRKSQEDPHWRDLILFYEYFHGDNGAGLGASHQTGWTGLVALLTDVFGRIDAKWILCIDAERRQARIVKEQVGGVPVASK